MLTNRPYYWLFVDRMGVVPETLNMHWIFDTSRESEHFQYVPRLPELACHFGAGGLAQIFQIAREKGRFVRLFEQVPEGNERPRTSRAYHTWVCINLKLVFSCDVKREELLSIGCNLQSGKLVTDFHRSLLASHDLCGRLQAQLPQQTHLARELFDLSSAWKRTLAYVESYVDNLDKQWICDAFERLHDEHARHDAYVAQLSEEMRALHAYERRSAEIERQYRPHICIMPVSCGIFHLNPASIISAAV
jgi:hypothetical protein